MFDTWKRRRKLERELAQLWDHFKPQFNAAKTEDDHREVYELFSIDSADTVRELELIKTRKIREQAIKFGVDFPPFEESSGDNWEKIPYSNGNKLTAKAETKLTRQIKVAKFAAWKQWAELLVPILSLLVSLVLAFAALKGKS